MPETVQYVKKGKASLLENIINWLRIKETLKCGTKEKFLKLLFEKVI